MKMEINQLKTIPLPDFLALHYGIEIKNGRAHCPFHPPDENPSFAVFQTDGGTWLWKCHHDGEASGSIIDFVSRKDRITVSAAIQKIKRLEGIEDHPAPSPKPERKVSALYDYKDASGKLIFQKIRYIPKTFNCRRPDGENWIYNTQGIKALPYRWDKVHAEPRVFLCEGEKDADNLAGLGYPSTSAPWGAGSWPVDLTPYFSGKAVYIVYDVGNEKKAQHIASELSGGAKEILIVSIPIERREADVSDFLDPFTSPDDKRAKFEELVFHAVKFEPPKPQPREGAFQPTLAERPADSIKIRAIPWLWHGVMPTHLSTAITGDAGQGKSLVTVDMAARVSCGTPFPIYDKPSPTVKGHVFYVTSEGVPEMILVPRLKAAGADLEKIEIIEGVYLRKDHFSMFDITANLPLIERRARDFPDLKLIIFDPIASFLPERINPSQQNAVRQAMDKISELAYKLGIAVPTVMHFNKGNGLKMIHKTSGSVQFEAAVKMSWSVVRREDDARNVRILVPQKSNITGGYKSLSFSIHNAEFEAPDKPGEIIQTAKISYGDLVDEDPETLISPIVETDSNVSRAVAFLKSKLATGTTLYAAPLIDDAERSGIPKWALYKAKDRLGVLHDKESHFQGKTFWYKPKAGGAQKPDALPL
jgi:hypothetical protein